MIRTWSDLSYRQRRVVAKISHESEAEERLGRQLDEFGEGFHSAIGGLLEEKIVEVNVGWRDAVWVTLTDRGRRIRDVGEAS